MKSLKEYLLKENKIDNKKFIESLKRVMDFDLEDNKISLNKIKDMIHNEGGLSNFLDNYVDVNELAELYKFNSAEDVLDYIDNNPDVENEIIKYYSK